MIIDSIQNGIVIDHITAGKSMELYQILGLDQLDCTVAILNVPRPVFDPAFHGVAALAAHPYDVAYHGAVLFAGAFPAFFMGDWRVLGIMP